MTDLRQAAQQAEPCQGKDPRCPCQDGDACHYKDCGDTKAQPEQPEQEPICYASINKQGDVCSTLKQRDSWRTVPLYTTPPAAQPMSMRMPKVGDKVICLEDESFGEVVSLTAGGSPDVTFDDGSRGTYLLREFAELFGYVTPPAAQWDKPSANFNAWWDSNVMPPANPFAEGSAAYWAWAGWKAAQRTWVGLTDDEVNEIYASGDAYRIRIVRLIEAKLKEKNT